MVRNDRPSFEDTNLERPTYRYLSALITALQKVAPVTVLYTQPSHLARQGSRHKKCLLLSIWAGERSRNRRSLVPAIAEAFGIPYAGPDVHASVLCQDKALAKEFGRWLGLSTPRAILYRTRADVASLRYLRMPVVVKPQYEGGSIGITRESLAKHVEEAIPVADRVIRTFCQPALIEEFVAGREVSLVVAGNEKGVTFIEAVEIAYEYAPESSNPPILYSQELKKGREGRKSHRLITEEVPPSVLSVAADVFRELQMVGLLRIDGRLNNGEFHLIELTPDVYIGPGGTAAEAFRLKGLGLPQMLGHVLDLTAQSHRAQGANK